MLGNAKAVLIGMMVCLVSAPSARAQEPDPSVGGSAIAHMRAHMHVPVVNAPEIVFAACPSGELAIACTIPSVDGQPVKTFIDPGFWFGPLGTYSSNRETLYHELGVQFDLAAMTPAARARFGQIIGSHLHWWNSESAGFGLAERFADAYAACALGRAPRHRGDIFTGFEYRPSPREYGRVCSLIARFGSRAGLQTPSPLGFKRESAPGAREGRGGAER